MFKPESFLCINWHDDLDNVSIQANVIDNRGWEIWGSMEDSFTADDLDAFATMFTAAARNLRERNSG